MYHAVPATSPIVVATTCREVATSYAVGAASRMVAVTVRTFPFESAHQSQENSIAFFIRNGACNLGPTWIVKRLDDQSEKI